MFSRPYFFVVLLTDCEDEHAVRGQQSLQNHVGIRRRLQVCNFPTPTPIQWRVFCLCCRLQMAIWRFAKRNHSCFGHVISWQTNREGLEDKDPLSGQSQDVVYLIVWSLLVLNTDTHNPKV